MCVYLIALRYPKCFTGLYLHVVNIFVLKCLWEDMILWRRYAQVTRNQGPDSIQRCHLTSIGNHIVEIRLSLDRLISTMGLISYTGKTTSLYWIRAQALFVLIVHCLFYTVVFHFMVPTVLISHGVVITYPWLPQHSVPLQIAPPHERQNGNYFIRGTL